MQSRPTNALFNTICTIAANLASRLETTPAFIPSPSPKASGAAGLKRLAKTRKNIRAHSKK